MGSLSGSWIGDIPKDKRLCSHKDFSPIAIPHRPQQKNLVFSAFSVNTNPTERMPAFEYFKTLDFVSSHSSESSNSRRLTEQEFCIEMASHKFVFSPPGNGIDCGRTWSALQVGSIPIVKKSILTIYLAKHLPLFLYNQISDISESSLESFNPQWPQEPCMLDTLYYTLKVDRIKNTHD